MTRDENQTTEPMVQPLLSQDVRCPLCKASIHMEFGPHFWDPVNDHMKQKHPDMPEDQRLVFELAE